MRKNLTYLMVIAVAALLTLPVQAQNSLAKKAAFGKGQPFRTGMIDKHAIQKAKTAKAMEAKTASFADVKGEDALAIAKAAKEADTTVGTTLAKWDWAAHATPKFVARSNESNVVRLPMTHKFNPLAGKALNASTVKRVETADEHGIITAPDEGETKYYNRAGTGIYYSSNYGVQTEDQSGVVEIVEAADGVVFIKDIVSTFEQGTWVKGTKEGNTITVAGAQPVAYSSTYDTTLSVNWGDYSTNATRDAGDITFTIDEEAQTISLEGSSSSRIIGIFWDDDNSWLGYGDYETVWTLNEDYVPPSTELVELPAGAEVQDWYADGTTNSGTVPTDAKVAFVGNDVYISGIFSQFPESWIKGTLEGTTVTFESVQYLGDYGSYNIWAIGFDEDYNLQDTFTFTYDAEAQTLTLDAGQNLVANAKADALYYLSYITGLTIYAEQPAPAQIDALPYSNDFNTADLQKHFTVINANADETTWVTSTDCFAISYATPNDDWLVSPAIKLVAGKKYHFAIDSKVQSASYPETFEVKAAAEATAEALAAGTTVFESQTIDNTEFETFETFDFTVDETGYYYIGIHNTSDDMWNQYVDNFLIEAAPISAPVTLDLTEEGAIADFGVIDNNEDGNTWRWNEDYASYGIYYIYSSANDADDYLILPIKLEAQKNYNVVAAVNAASVSYPEKFEVKVGKEGTVEGLNQTVIAEQTVTSIEPVDYEGSFTTDEDGIYYVAIHATSDADMWRLCVTKLTVDIGAESDAPAAVENLAITPLEDVLGATITFNAPTKAINGDDLAADGIAKIELLRDGNVITTFEDPAPGAELSYVDQADDLTIGTHKYQAIVYGASGIGGKSDEISVFLTATLDVPYYVDFSVNGSFEAFQVIDNNEDLCTWAWHADYNAYYNYNSEEAADDYLVTSPIRLQAGKSYKVTVNAMARSASYPEKFEVVAGKEATAEALNIAIIGATELATTEGEDYEGEFTVDEDGEYFVAIHAISDANMWRLIVNSLAVEKGAEPNAPAAPLIEATAGVEGDLSATVKVTAPTTSVDGNELTDNISIDVLADGEVIATKTDVAPGAVIRVLDEPAASGIRTYQAIPSNEAGGPGQKSEKVSIFVGVDEPGAIENFLIAASTATTVTFTWDEIVGANGGYINADNAEYTIYSLAIENNGWWNYLVADEPLATVTNETTATIDFPVDEGEQQYKYFGISVKMPDTEESDPAEAYSYLLVGAPDELPIEEGFAGNSFHYNWNSSDAAALYVSDDATDGDGVALQMLSYDDDATVGLWLDKIDLKSAANPTLLFDVKSDEISSLRVIGSKDGEEITTIATESVSGEYTTVKVSLADIVGSRYSTVGFEADFATATTFDWWYGTIEEMGDALYVDNIKIMDLLEYNLVADITAPKSVVAGKEAKVKITLRNMGENVAEGYTVKLFAGDEEIELEDDFAAIEPFTSKVIEATFAPTIFDEAGTVTLRAEVEYELDLDDDDNVVETSIEVKEPAVTAPESLTATAEGQKALLEWTVAEGEGVQSLTEGFDDEEVYEPFSIGGITEEEQTGQLGEWTVYDGNNMGVYGFQSIEFENSYVNQAWQVFNPEQLGIEDSYAPYSPAQFLWSMCPVEDSNAPAADHWLISPELPGVAQSISFQQRIITADYGAETFEVLASASDKDPGSFNVVADFSKSNTEWEEINVNLPEGTKFFAIRHTSTDVFGLLVDDITYLTGGGEISAFNIYVDEVLVGSVEGGVLTFTTDVLPAGEHKVSVTALYGENESRPVDASVIISEPTAISEIINVDKLVDIFTLDGKLVRHNANSVKDLKPGVYVIDNQKVTVK